MKLTTSGVIIGVRALEANRTTGELSKFCTLDLYDPEEGPAEIRCPLELKLPDVGSSVVVNVKVGAFSGFVKDAKDYRQGVSVAVAGEARITYTATSVTVVRTAAKDAARDAAKVA